MFFWMYQRGWSPSYKKQLIYPIVGILVHPYDIMYIWRDRYIHNHTLHRYLDRYSWYSHREPVFQNSWWKYPPIAGTKTPSDHRRRRVPRGRGKKHWVSKDKGCFVPFPYPIRCLGRVVLPMHIWLLFMVNHGKRRQIYQSPWIRHWYGIHPNCPNLREIFIQIYQLKMDDLKRMSLYMFILIWWNSSGIKMSQLSTLPMLNLVLLLQDQLRHGVLS